MARKHVVLAFFADEAAADAAVEELKAWDELYYDIKLNAIGVLVVDENGRGQDAQAGSPDHPQGYRGRRRHGHPLCHPAPSA